MILRSYREEDFDALHELYAAVETAAFGRAETTVDELRTWLTAPTVNVETDVRLAFDGDELVGYVDIDRVDADPPRWWSDVRARPGRNERQLVPALLDWAEARASDGGILRVWAAKPLVEVRQVFEARGFRWVRGSYRMEIDLHSRLPSPPPLPGIEIRVAREGGERTAYDVHQETFEDSWEHTHEPYEEWQHWLENESSDRTLWFIAWDGDRAAGVSLCRVRDGVGWSACSACGASGAGAVSARRFSSTRSRSSGAAGSSGPASASTRRA